MEDRFYLSDGYKRSVLEHMSLPQLLDTLLIHATVYISPSYRDTGLTASYSFKPLSNLVYTRDQQASLARIDCTQSSQTLSAQASSLSACSGWYMSLCIARCSGCCPCARCGGPACADRPLLSAQITTCKGIVMARLRSTVRELEVALMRFCFEKLGAQAGGVWWFSESMC